MNEHQVSLDDIMPLMLETLSQGKTVTFSPHGKSMLPMLREGRDSVTLASPPNRLNKYDVALYQRKNGQYVLHRIVRVKDTYSFVGDNQFAIEKGIEQSQIIAVCTSFTRNGKEQSPISFGWRAYAVLWHYSRFPRRVIRAIARRVNGIFCKK